MNMSKLENDKCPTCLQELPDAMTKEPRGAAMQCEFCDQQAHFIIYNHAACFDHRERAQRRPPQRVERAHTIG
jgi:hypothetical protein